MVSAGNPMNPSDGAPVLVGVDGGVYIDGTTATGILALSGTMFNSSEEENSTGYNVPEKGGGITSTIEKNGKTITFGHGGRHLEGTGLSVEEVNQVLADEVSTLIFGAGQFHKGQIVIDGITIEYTSFGVSSNRINIGTYYPLQ